MKRRSFLKSLAALAVGGPAVLAEAAPTKRVVDPFFYYRAQSRNEISLRGTTTGRWSSSGPNFQEIPRGNIPKHDYPQFIQQESRFWRHEYHPVIVHSYIMD